MLTKISAGALLNALLLILLATILAVCCLALFLTQHGGSNALSAEKIQASILVVSLVGAALGVWLWAAIPEAAARPLRAATAVLGRLADGDLTVKAQGMNQVHTTKLGGALDATVAELRKLVAEVMRAAHGVADTTAQIAHGNLDLSQRTEEQASSLQQTASAMEELTATVAQNAENARQASTAAAGASQAAQAGGEVVAQVVLTMNDIAGSSRRIEDIIGIIDSIAFQTNILALNAAVEAARAGELGRGFAVVASEVRSLAHRCSAAAKDVKVLVADSRTKVEAGAGLVSTAGSNMTAIVETVRNLHQRVAEIAAASQEQSVGIRHVNTNVAQMEQVVQQNASLVEEASAATESLNGEAALLLEMVARFNVGNEIGAFSGAGTDLRQQPGSHRALSTLRQRHGFALVHAGQGNVGVTAHAAA
jgi:methyl-accepting chemotaxis protein